MMSNEITARVPANKRPKRVGRGDGSGSGKTSGRGHKGAQSRSGCDIRPLAEGGQMPLFRRLPKRGFSNFNFRTEYDIVNVGTLNERFGDGDTVDVDVMQKMRLVQSARPLVRVLAKGTLEKKLTVEAHAFSRQAREAIEKAGGTVRLIERRSAAEKARAKRNQAKAGRMQKTERSAAPRGAEEPPDES